MLRERNHTILDISNLTYTNQSIVSTLAKPYPSSSVTVMMQWLTYAKVLTPRMIHSNDSVIRATHMIIRERHLERIF